MGAVATGSLKALVKVGKTVGREAVRPGGGYKVGGIRWKEAEPTSRLRTTNRQRNRFLEKVSRFHEFFSYSPVGTSNIGAGLADFQGSFSILEAKQELMMFPVCCLIGKVLPTPCSAWASELFRQREEDVAGISSLQLAAEESLVSSLPGEPGAF